LFLSKRGNMRFIMLVSLLFPKTDTGLLQWSQNVVNLITPTPADWGLVTGDVTTYTASHNAYSTALAACDPAIRNKPAVVSKNVARRALKVAAAILANKIYASSDIVTDAMKVEIGMPPRATPTQIAAPTTAPVIEFISSIGCNLQIRLRGATGSGRGKEPGTTGASVFSFVGASAPGDISGWKFEGNVGRVEKINLTFPDTTAAGAKIWLTAFWFNGRKQSGPATTPVCINLPGGGVVTTA
jgi:hypothetical protein